MRTVDWDTVPTPEELEQQDFIVYLKGELGRAQSELDRQRDPLFYARAALDRLETEERKLKARVKKLSELLDLTGSGETQR